MAAAFTEASTIQAAICHRLTRPDLGWTEMAADRLQREDLSALIEPDIVAALVRLNPAIAEDPGRVEQVLPMLRAVVLSVQDVGLVPANEHMISWLRGLESYKLVGQKSPGTIRLIDFDEPRSNKLVVSREVRFAAGAKEPRKYDIVLWVNGFPLVVGETKTPFDAASKSPGSTGHSKSWLTGARDIHNVYELETPGFFVPNAFNFATEGKDFRFGPIGMPAEMWQPWSRTDEPILPLGLERAIRSAELLLAPDTVLEMLRSYSLYSTLRVGNSARAIKIVARYPQVEAVEAVVKRAADPMKRQGLIWHHQGSGKTYLAAYACGKLRRELPGSTVVVVLDRLDLIEQTTREFESAGVKRLRVAETREQLRGLLGEDQRGVIVTTIHRFKEAGLLNKRSDIIALIDEAHRTQEGSLGMDMRTALPNATYFGLTGTAISEKDRDTFENFGDPGDPDSVLSIYSPDRSMADGATLPLRVEAPRPSLQLDKDELDEAFDEMAAEEGLTEEEKEQLARKASKAKTLFKADARVVAICKDIVEHFYTRIDPLGMKAQIVAYDRELCVLYQDTIQMLLNERGDGDRSTIVMTVNNKADPQYWRQYDRDRADEAKVKAQFRDVEDPLKFLIVTAKLLTGFDAPVEGVMYLDKPLRKHTLFQALTRTNRRWTNPKTGQEKTDGLIVDYVGLGKEIAASLQVKRRKDGKDPLSTDELKVELESGVQRALHRFDGIDLKEASFTALGEAQERMPAIRDREDFAREYLKIQALFELLWPDSSLSAIRERYRWLAKVYLSIQPAITPDALLWHRLGAKTLALVNQHVVSVDVRGTGVERVTIDEETLDALRKLGVTATDEEGAGREPPTAEEILDSIERRIEQRLEETDDAQYRSLAERLDKLRETQIASATESIEFLKQILEVAREVVAVDRAMHEKVRRSDGGDRGRVGLLPEERIGALTQILKEFKPEATPAIIERVVQEIDAVVSASRFTAWQTSREGTRTVKTEIRKALKKFGLPATGGLFDRAYDYVAEHY